MFILAPFFPPFLPKSYRDWQSSHFSGPPRKQTVVKELEPTIPLSPFPLFPPGQQMAIPMPNGSCPTPFCPNEGEGDRTRFKG